MKIIVVDDESATEQLFKQQFKEEIKNGEFEFSFSPSAEEALRKLDQNGHPEAVLILSDINMPGMSGLELLKEVKEKHPQTPVMIVTAYGDEANHKKALSYKADGFINKPIDFGALKNKMMKYSGIDRSKSKHLRTAKILVVDDEPALEALINQKFRAQIKEGSMKFVFASNGFNALKIFDADKEIGVVLTDINMPEMDGLTLLAKLKERNRVLRSVIISAYGDMENIRAAKSLGVSEFITKPINLNDLKISIESALEEYRHLTSTKLEGLLDG